MKEDLKYPIFRIENEEIADKAAEWFHDKWSISKEAYLESILDSINNETGVPSWYLCTDGDRIVGGLGVIENDFHERKDLRPNVCAVFTEKDYRCQGIAGRLLNLVCSDMKSKGTDTLYLVTDHDSFYERYGWEFYTTVKCDGGEISRLYRKITK